MQSFCKNNRRYLYAAVGFVLLLFLGLIYSWSVFIGPLEADFGWERSQTSSIFTISILFFWLGNVASGFTSERLSPRATILIAAACAVAGFAASSFTTSLPWIYVSYGVLCGFAVGMGSNGVLSCVLGWFPGRQGIASGALMMGIGLGSLVLGPVVTSLLGSVGWRGAFLALSVAFGALMIGGALILRAPERPRKTVETTLKDSRRTTEQNAPARALEHAESETREFTAPEMLRTRAFWTFMLWAVLIGTGGLALISNAVPAAQDVLLGSMDEAAALMTAAMAMGSISAFNGFGRLASGFLWDRKGCRFVTVLISSVYAVSMAACAFGAATGTFAAVVAGFIALGTAYGASIATTSAMIGSVFGQRHYGMNYACALANMVLAACIGPTISGAVHASTGSYFAAYAVFFALAVASAVVALWMRVPHRAAKQKNAPLSPAKAARSDAGASR